MKEKISVIVPIYNVENYIEKCILSIINQTYTNLEIILVDDGSTDNSSKIIDEYAKKDSRIKVIHKKNEGVSIAKNLGMKESTSNFISFIDSDDTVTPDYIEILYNNLINTNSDISVIGYKVVTENNNILFDSIYGCNLKKDQVIVYEGIEKIKELLLQKTIKNFGCKLYRKDVLINFPVGVTYEDIVFSLEVIMRSKRVVYTNKSLYNYLKRNNSITATISSKNLNDFANAIYNRYILVKENYKELDKYNIYSFFQSTIALSTKSAIIGMKYEDVNNRIIEFINIIKEYAKDNEEIILTMLSDYEKTCLYLMRYNIDLYYMFLVERQRLKNLGLLN